MATSIYLGNPPENIKKWIEANYKIDETIIPMYFEAQEPNASIKFSFVDWQDYECSNENISINGEQLNDDMFLLLTSYDNKTWVPYELGTTIILNNVGDKIYFKAGIQNSSFYLQATATSSDLYGRFKTTNKLKTGGNIQFLLDPTGKRIDVPRYCFYKLFKNTTISTTPLLPASILNEHCYEEMFYGCYNLSSTPELPAENINLSDYCYNNMFVECNNITYIGKINAKASIGSFISYNKPLMAANTSNEIITMAIFGPLGNENVNYTITCSDNKTVIATFDGMTMSWNYTIG